MTEIPRDRRAIIDVGAMTISFQDMATHRAAVYQCQISETEYLQLPVNAIQTQPDRTTTRCEIMDQQNTTQGLDPHHQCQVQATNRQQENVYNLGQLPSDGASPETVRNAFALNREIVFADLSAEMCLSLLQWESNLLLVFHQRGPRLNHGYYHNGHQGKPRPNYARTPHY